MPMLQLYILLTKYLNQTFDSRIFFVYLLSYLLSSPLLSLLPIHFFFLLIKYLSQNLSSRTWFAPLLCSPSPLLSSASILLLLIKGLK